MPGGVGPMTVAMLLRNTVYAWKGHVGLRPEKPPLTGVGYPADKKAHGKNGHGHGEKEHGHGHDQKEHGHGHDENIAVYLTQEPGGIGDR